MDIEEDKKSSAHHGWPFLATRRTLIDVVAGELSMRVNNEKLVFNVLKATQYLEDNDDCLNINLDYGVTAKVHDDAYPQDTLEAVLTIDD